MRTVEIYVGTTLRGSGKGVGKGMYIMQSRMPDGRVHEKKAAVEIDGGTESRLVLYCLRDSLARFQYACKVTVYTECTYIAAAINSRWPEAWREKGWVNGRGAKAKDSGLWRDILWHLEDTGHEISAVAGKHEFSGWMRVNLPMLYASRDIFTEMDEAFLDSVNNWICRQTGPAAYGDREQKVAPVQL